MVAHHYFETGIARSRTRAALGASRLVFRRHRNRLADRYDSAAQSPSKRNRRWPTAMTSPFTSRMGTNASRRCHEPSTWFQRKVPFDDSRSTTPTSHPSKNTSACERETDLSRSSMMSPCTDGRPAVCGSRPIIHSRSRLAVCPSSNRSRPSGGRGAVIGMARSRSSAIPHT